MNRSGPIGVLHRLLWYHVPGIFRRLDKSLTGGRILPHFAVVGRYLWSENHPIILVCTCYSPAVHLCLRGLAPLPRVGGRLPACFYPSNQTIRILCTIFLCFMPERCSLLFRISLCHVHSLLHHPRQPPRAYASLPL